MIYVGDEESLDLEMVSMEQFLVSKGIEVNYNPWDTIKQSPTGEFYIFSPTGQPRFEGYAPQYVTEIELPEEWIENGDE